MQHDPRLKRTTTSLYHRRSSPIKVDKIREERPANSHPLVPIPNGAAVKAPVTVPTAPPNREVENIQHSEYQIETDSSPIIANSPLMQGAHTQDPRLRGRLCEPAPASAPSNSTKILVTHSQSTILDGPSSIIGLLDPIQQRISCDYQKMYEIHQRNFVDYQQDNERRHVEAGRRYDDLQEKLVDVEKLRSEEKGRWEAEKKELTKRLDHCKASYTGQLEEKKTRIVQLENDKGVLAQQLKQSFIDRNSIVAKLEEEKRDWEVERKILMENLETCKQDAMASAEMFEQERANHAETLRKFDKETQQLRHEKTILTSRLKDERIAREGMITAMRLSGRDEREAAKFIEEERERKRLRLG
ncbi:hypothetical protein JR316_0012439 [Psilocybe cubensis]|uniref:Uncharacterized protein n=2 Tax=Psilocybe cubensis TaxID=181762 RepID=A0ACB8GI83_PSICU|nr:hypothetical protein JR316_0012439 [Psilocybe cubensis]KAH9475328.1 hypothetical protein JR316_0012439 [Psilocybe cubensis]